MRRVNFNYAEAGIAGATRCLREGGHRFLNALDRELARHGIVRGKRNGTRSYNVWPTTIGFGNRALSAFPRPVRAGFSSRMRQLHSGDAALLMNEADNSLQWFDMIVAPDAEILRTDAGLGQNGGRFGKNQASSTNCAAAQVHEMPVVRKSVVARILAHG